MTSYQHQALSGNFGYVTCSLCGGWWEGPEKPEDSPCTREAQSIRDVRTHYEWLLTQDKLEEANEYLAVCLRERPLAFNDGKLKEYNW